MKNNPKKVFEELKKINFLIVDQKVKQLDLTGVEFKKVKEEALKFFALCICNNKRYSPSKLVDLYWHEMVLNTKQYAEICKKFGKFIHHQPTDDGQNSKMINSEAFNATIKDYKKYFRKLPIKEVWGVNKHSFENNFGLSKKEIKMFEEISGIMKKHRLKRKFGLCLIHNHFKIRPDETLYETNNPVSRTHSVSVRKKAELIYAKPTQWRLY